MSFFAGQSTFRHPLTDRRTIPISARVQKQTKQQQQQQQQQNLRRQAGKLYNYDSSVNKARDRTVLEKYGKALS